MMPVKNGKTGAKRAPKIDRKAALAAVTGAQLAEALGHTDGGRAVRRWLRANGVRLQRGGKITPKVVRAYMTAHGITVSAPKVSAPAAPQSAPQSA